MVLGMGEVYRRHPTYEEVYEGFKDKWGYSDEDVEVGGVVGEEEMRKLAEVKKEIQRRQKLEPLKFYEPYESRLVRGRRPQDEFHRSEAKIRLMLGGNRSGKSEAGFAEDVWWATGSHPYKNLGMPTHGWVVSLNFKKSVEVTEPMLRKFMPCGMVQRWDSQMGLVKLKNGSTIGLKSCDQDLETFGGKPLHWVHFDEEPPGMKGQKIYEECLMRTMDYRGKVWLTLTPVLGGMSWSYDEIVERAVYDNDIYYIEVDSRENPYIPMDEIESNMRKLSEDEIELRIKGRYIQFSGKVYKEFDKGENIIEPLDYYVYKDWPKYRGLDHGINRDHPTACVWLTVSPQGEVYVYDEYRESDKTIKENCEAINLITGRDKIAWTMIDPSTDARDPQTGRTNRDEYARNGVRARAMRVEKNVGINCIRQMLAKDRVTGRPRLYIFKTCHNLIREFSRYRWREYRGSNEERRSNDVVKINDDLLDALRYAVTSSPQYLLDDGSSEPERQVWYR